MSNLATPAQSSLKRFGVLSNGNYKPRGYFLFYCRKMAKEALAKLIMYMRQEASKTGVLEFNLDERNGKTINASISVASENNPQKHLKTAFPRCYICL